MDKKKLMNQPYRLTVSQYVSSAHMERIIMRIIESMQPRMLYKKREQKNTFSNQTIRVKTKSLLPENSKNYTCVKQALRKLKSTEIKIKGIDKFGNFELFTGFILQYKYYQKNEFVDIEMSNELIDYLLNNKQGYTRYSLDIAFNSSSSYTMRLYKWICHWRDKIDGFIVPLTVEHLRDLFGLENKYKTSGLCQRILLPTMRELKERADVWFDIKESIKEGRKVVGWKIQIRKKKELSPSSKQLSTTKAKGTTANQHAQERANLLAIRDRWKDKIDLP